ncbi:hypothetical protein CPB85DRAFT_1290856 [Mucidula mucida]|nr:hypothetical protein CPB85DRAFT_1290856 [Mucidula mucida]
MDSPLTQEVDTAVSEDKPEEADEEEVQRCSLCPLPFATLASDIVWKYRQKNVYCFSEDETKDKLPSGIIPMLTKCYSPACSDLYPCSFRSDATLRLVISFLGPS